MHVMAVEKFGSVQQRKGGPSSYFIGIGADVVVPMQIHSGSDCPYAGKGVFDEQGRIYWAGHFAESGHTAQLQLTARHDQDCVCLPATNDFLTPKPDGKAVPTPHSDLAEPPCPSGR